MVNRMVKRQVRISPLNRKLLRDFREGWKSFAAIALICTLAITLYVGIDSTWRGIDSNLDEQFAVGNMADLWVQGAITDRTVRDLAALPGVSEAQRRVVVDGKADKLPGEPDVLLMMSDGPARINKPWIAQGGDFPPGQKNTVILQERFAAAHGLQVGDVLDVKVNGNDLSLTVCGLGTLAEYVVSTHGGEFSPDPVKFGYACVAPGTLGDLPYTLAFMTLEPGAEPEQVKREAQELLDGSQAVVLTREDIPGIKMAMDESQQIRAMGQIFPVVFFIIAALITWTTMGRLVENQRMQIGTLFSQGYGKGALTWHFASYGLVLALLGAAGGFCGARYFIGPVVLNMLKSLYVLPGATPYLRAEVLIAVSLLLAAITGGASVLSARSALRLCPASLLRPKPPGKGRRVLLENIDWIWKRLKFSNKMIQRNLGRNPMRLLMGLVGAMGCTAMMLTGFGLRDSVDYVLRNYYTTTMCYDACAYLEGDAPTDYGEAVRLRAGADRAQERMVTTCEAFLDDQWLVKQAFVYPDQHDMVYITREDGSQVFLPEKGVALTTKASEEYGLNVGDLIELRTVGGRSQQAMVIDVIDIQLGQGIYMSRSAWRALDIAPWRPNSVMLQGESLTLDAVADMDGVDYVRSIGQERDSNSKVLSVLNLVVVLLVLFSGALALVVLYNLGQLNFAERTRELATLMVLGFTQREIKRLILRENFIIVCIGLPIGLALGPFLHQLVLETGLPNTLEFVPYIKLISWIITSAFTLLFALLVNFMLGRKFRKVNMVEALKSIE